MEGNHTTCCDWHGFSRLGVAAWTLGLLTQVKVAEVGEFYPIALFQSRRYFLKESIDHVLGFTLVQANLFNENIDEFCLGQGLSVTLDGAPGFLPGAFGGINDAGRHWVPSNRSSPLNRARCRW